MGEYSGTFAVAGDDRDVSLERRLYSRPSAFQREACKHIDKAPIGLLYPEMQYELRRMAVQLVGIPPLDHSMHNVVQHWVDEQRREPTTSTLPFQQDNQYA